MKTLENSSPHRLKSHYVICNWNNKIFELLRELNPKNVGIDSRTVVVITEKTIDQSIIPTDSESSIYFEDVMFYPGDPSKADVLRRVNFQDSHCVIVLANPRLGNHADAQTLLTLFSMIGRNRSGYDDKEEEIEKNIRKTLEERKKKENPLHIVAEITDVTNYSKFKVFEDDQDVCVEIVRPESIRTRILAQAARTQGLASFFIDLMTFGEDTNEVYSARIPEIWFEKYKKVGKETFSDLCLWFNELRNNHKVVAIPVGIWRPPHCIKGESDGTFVNPPDHFEIRERDRVLVICRNREIANKIELISKE